MEFVHRPYIPEETITAIATAPGEGGISVIRVSGKEALKVVSSIYTGPIFSYQTHTAHLGKIQNKQGQLVDEVLVLVMLGKRSFTGEDTVEIHCHGGSLVTKKVLECILDAGARAALPGEFTFKAFMNGKIDLSQAEAVQELIGAKNEIALHHAEEQLQGSLSKRIKEFQKELFDIAAILEAWVDFPEEGLEFATKEELLATLQSIVQKMKKLSSTFHEGKVIKEGLSLCLIGTPNAGKSSLMNVLLGKDRAIVTDIPGTTRDVLEEDLLLGGLHFRLLDTAGIRETCEVVEKEGIRRSKLALEKADLVLLLLDASKEMSDEDHLLLSSAPTDKTIVVWNKMDLPRAECFIATSIPSCSISAKEAMGIDELKEKIQLLIWRKGPPPKEEVVLTNARHKQALDQAILFCETLITNLQKDLSPEFLSSDMRSTLLELGTIIGSNISEDILSAIFSKFCVGK